MIIFNVADNSQRKKLFKIAASIFMCFLSSLLVHDGLYAMDKTQALENLQSIVKDPEKAREYRRRIKNSSEEELKEFDGLREKMQKEMNTISSSLPTSVDRYTTTDSAFMSGNNVAFRYTLSKEMPGLEHKSKLMSDMISTLKKSICTSPVGAYLILGYVWSYFYFDENGQYIGGVSLDAKTCGFE